MAGGRRAVRGRRHRWDRPAVPGGAAPRSGLAGDVGGRWPSWRWSARCSAVVWLTGAIGGWLNAEAAGHGCPPRPPATVLIRLPGHLGDPRAAWPVPWPSRLPGAAWLYLIALRDLRLVRRRRQCARPRLYRFVRPSALGAPRTAYFTRAGRSAVQRGPNGRHRGTLLTCGSAGPATVALSSAG